MGSTPTTFEPAARATLADLAPAWAAHQQARTDMNTAWAGLHNPAQPWHQTLMRLLDAHDRLTAAAPAADTAANTLARLIRDSETDIERERRWTSITAWAREVDCGDFSWTDPRYALTADREIRAQRARLAEAHALSTH